MIATLLIVDDDPLVCQAMQRTFEDAGYRVLVAQDGEEALRLAAVHRPDLVLLNVNLPTMNGFEVLRRLKSDAEFGSLFVVFVSSTRVDTNSQIQGLEAGADGYLTWPISNRELLARIQSTLRIKAAEDDLRLLHTVGLAVSAADDFDAALTATLAAICLETGWTAGEAWVFDAEADALVLAPAWHTSIAALEPFRQVGLKMRLKPGSGLAGIVWAGKKAQWVTDVANDPTFLRSTAAQQVGIHGAFAVPILAGAEVVAVMIFLMNTPQQRDARLEKMVETVASQLGMLFQRKQAEAATLREQQLIASMLESLPGIFYLLDAQGRFLRWNMSLELVSGYSADELRGMVALDLFAHEEREEIAQRMRRVFTAGYTDLEANLIANDGKATPYYFTGALAQIDQQPCVVGMGIDISERVQSGRALQRQLQDLTVLHRVALTCAKVTHPDELIAAVIETIGDALYPDHVGVMLLDTTAGCLRPHPSYRGIADDVRRRWQAIPLDQGIVAQVVRSSLPVRADDVRQLPNYFEIHESTRSELCVPIAIGGRVLGVINAESDQLGFFGEEDERLLLTIAGQLATALERLRLFAETGLHAEQIEQIMRSVPDGVLLLDGEQRLLQINPAGREYLARLGHSHRCRARCDYNQGHETPVERDILTRLGDHPLAQLLTSPPGGRWHEIHQDRRIFESLARPLAAGPTAGGWVMLLREVTRQREVQEQLQRQERLAAVGQLAAGIAHDFNNLMGAILLHAHLLNQSTALFGKERDRLHIIQGQARHASAMIEQILDFSRRSVLESQPLNLLPLLKEQVKLLQRTLPEHIGVDLIEQGSDYIILADPTRIQQMVMNLAINARDAMPQGGRLTLHLERLHLEQASDLPLPGMRTGDWVRLTVSDTGTGMSPDVLDHLFEPFFTTKAPGKGTGLGLAQVYGIVGQHNGHISVRSQPGEGTVFTMYLPALATPARESIAAPEEDLPQGNGELVLIIEDNASLRAALADYLELHGYRALTAGDGSDALEILANLGENPALILSDVVMPHMGGVAMIQALRQQGNQTPVILLTGHPLDEMEVQGLRSQGVSAWLTKPLNLTVLAKAITQALTHDG